MSIGETLLIFGGIPLAVIAVVSGWAFAANARSAPRYRPGRPFTFTPVWYLADAPPEQAEHTPAPAIGAGVRRPVPVVRRPTESGGARGTW